jgi:hypothetical protein
MGKILIHTSKEKSIVMPNGNAIPIEIAITITQSEDFILQHEEQLLQYVVQPKSVLNI